MQSKEMDGNRESDYRIVLMRQGNAYGGKDVTYYRPYKGETLTTHESSCHPHGI